MSNNTAFDPRSELELARTNINQLVNQVSGAQWQLGIIYNYIVSARLAEAVGYKSAWDYLSRSVNGISRTSLSMYSNVAAYITREFVARYGMERIRAWLNYQRATRASIPWTDPGGILMRVPLDGGWHKTKPLSDCNVDEVRRTTRAVRNRPKTRVAVTDAVRSLFLGESVSQHFKDVAAVRFNVRSQDGKALITLADVPVAEVERLIQALQTGLEAQPVSLRPEKQRAA
jgi:hypothetical protein